MGEQDCVHGYVDSLMPWLDRHGVSYLAWAWNTWDCARELALITDYSGTPTNFGLGLHKHLAPRSVHRRRWHTSKCARASADPQASRRAELKVKVVAYRGHDLGALAVEP
jgi:hypothetical protein